MLHFFDNCIQAIFELYLVDFQAASRYTMQHYTPTKRVHQYLFDLENPENLGNLEIRQGGLDNLDYQVFFSRKP